MANRLPFDFVESVTRFTNRRLSAESRRMLPVIHLKESGSWPGNSTPLESSGRSSFDFVRWFVWNGTVTQMIRWLSRAKWISSLGLKFVHYSSTAGNCIRAPLEGAIHYLYFLYQKVIIIHAGVFVSLKKVQLERTAKLLRKNFIWKWTKWPNTFHSVDANVGQISHLNFGNQFENFHWLIISPRTTISVPLHAPKLN
jgi:hypothetical protein